IVGVFLFSTAIATAVLDPGEGVSGDRLDATGSQLNISDTSIGSDEEDDFGRGNLPSKEEGCFPTDLCKLSGGFCVKTRKQCKAYGGTFHPRGCTGKGCKCCVPSLPLPSDVTWHVVGSDQFVRFPMKMNWYKAQALCQTYNLNLYHPIDSVAVSEYLEINFDTNWYWLYAKGNGMAQVWLDDGVDLTSADPWWPKIYSAYWRNNGTNTCLGLITWNNNYEKDTVLFARENSCTYYTAYGIICG
ncbi:unnamed protein product, partial [Meganyctiphanes norvegica]